MQALVTNYYETAAMILFSIGFTMLLLQKNLIKKAIGLNIMDMSVYLFLAAKGYIAGSGRVELPTSTLSFGRHAPHNARQLMPVPSDQQ